MSSSTVHGEVKIFSSVVFSSWRSDYEINSLLLASSIFFGFDAFMVPIYTSFREANYVAESQIVKDF